MPSWTTRSLPTRSRARGRLALSCGIAAAAGGAAAALGPAAAASSGGGAIAGAITFDGPAPERDDLAMAEDPVCAAGAPHPDEDLVVDGGKLQDVHVRLRASDVSGDYEAPDDAVEIDQVECMYRPRVSGAMLGQRLAIANSDDTLHNVHGYVGGSTSFNLGQPPRGPDIEREIGETDVLELRCDVHPWMRAYIVVTEHPFFDVTGRDGAFEIEGVPAGDYTLEAWHPELGLETSQVAVEAGETARAELTFAGD